MRGTEYAVVNEAYLVVCRHDYYDSGDFIIIHNQHGKIR